MPDGVNADVQADQAVPAQAPVDRMAGEAECSQLRRRHHAVLLGSERGERLVGLAAGRRALSFSICGSQGARGERAGGAGPARTESARSTPRILAPNVVAVGQLCDS
jgi:hypothetical protein